VCFVEFADRESAEQALGVLAGSLASGFTAWIAAGAKRSSLLDVLEMK
jgi:hypothetical protein